jgi:hypothetical protein
VAGRPHILNTYSKYRKQHLSLANFNFSGCQSKDEEAGGGVRGAQFSGGGGKKKSRDVVCDMGGRDVRRERERDVGGGMARLQRTFYSHFCRACFQVSIPPPWVGGGGWVVGWVCVCVCVHTYTQAFSRHLSVCKIINIRA